jgi:hypothetical protein
MNENQSNSFPINHNMMRERGEERREREREEREREIVLVNGQATYISFTNPERRRKSY